MKQKLYYLFGIVTLLTVGLSIPAYAATGLVTASSVNVRQEATTSSEVVETLSENTKVEVIKETDGWYQIKVNDKQGYIKSDFLSVEEEKTETKSEQTSTENTKNVKLLKSAKVRILPVINSNILGDLAEGTEVEVITKTNNWAFVQNEKIIGWIPRSFIETKKEEVKEEKTEEVKEENKEAKQEEKQEEKKEEKQEQKSSETIYSEAVKKYVAYSSVNVRAEPTTDSDAITSVILNTDIKVIGENNGWFKVKVDGEEGYIRQDLLSDTKKEVTSRSSSERVQVSSSEATSGTGVDIVNFAKQYLGCPYSYGAAGSSSFDCSGFTMYVYDHFGVSLPHTATGQSKYGTSVSSSELQPGDLVFFRDYQTNVGIGHVGIYIGGGEFIHASSGSGYCVKISDLTSGSYANRYMCAVRLI